MGIFTQTYCMISDGGHAYGAKEFSKHMQKFTSPQLLTFEFETHIMGRGWPSASPHCNLTSMYDDRNFAQESCVPWTSIHAALALEEKF